nr:hypothetical protein [Mesorhizobium sp.]
MAEYLAHHALHQLGETFMSGPRSILARMARRQPRRPQLVRIAMLFGLVARHRYQPGLGLWRDRRLLAGSRSVVEGRQRAMGQRPLDAALDCLMMDAKAPPYREERRILTVGEQHSRPFNPPRRLGSRARKRRQTSNLLIAHRQRNRLPPSCHFAAPRSDNCQRGIREQPNSSMNASFMESII